MGLNYRDHIAETGSETPEFPTVFAKFAPALVGAHDDIVLPAVSDKVDWEAELVVVVGAPVRHATPDQAAAAIAGYTVLNDVSVRDYQCRTTQFLQGKTFERHTGGADARHARRAARGWLGDQHHARRRGRAALEHGELIFTPVDLIGYLSTIVTLKPGDVIATGTPGARARAQAPALPGRRRGLVTAIAGIGECRNTCRAEEPAGPSR